MWSQNTILAFLVLPTSVSAFVMVNSRVLVGHHALLSNNNNKKKRNGHFSRSSLVSVATGNPYGEWNSDDMFVQNATYPVDSSFLIPSDSATSSLVLEEEALPTVVPTVDDSNKADDDTVVAEKSSSSASVAGTTFSVMKAMLGSGVLALPSGLAAISDYKGAVWSANLLFVVLGLLSAYTFSLYGRLCHATNASSLGEVWKRVHQTQDSTPISLASFSFCYGSCLIFLLIIGDTVSSLVRALTTTASLPFLAAMGSRQTAILAVMTSLLLPLCNLKSLAALSPISIVGVLASIVSSAFVVWRCPWVVPSSPYHVVSASTGSTFLPSLAAHYVPQFGSYCKLASTAPLVLLGMGGMALMAHFSAPDFYQALAGGTPRHEQQQQDGSTATTVQSDLPLQKYRKATIWSFITVGIVNAITMTCGFLTFGGNSAGMILNNYATQDVGAAVSRMLVAVSMIGGFPLLFLALRSAATDLWASSSRSDSHNQELLQQQSTAVSTNQSGWKLKLGLLSSLTALSMLVKDVGMVVGLNGAITGSAIIYSFPALLFLRFTRPPNSGIVVRKGERTLCRGLVAFGIVSAVLGGATTLLKSCG